MVLRNCSLLTATNDIYIYIKHFLNSLGGSISKTNNIDELWQQRWITMETLQENPYCNL